MLALRIEFLNGVYHAADPAAPDSPEWPPHPDRVFQALVASAHGAGLDPAPLRALEGQAPELRFGRALPVQGATCYVPVAYRAPQSRVGRYDPMMVAIRDPVYLIWATAADAPRETLAPILAAVTYLGRARTPVAMCLADSIPDLDYRLTPRPHGEDGDTWLRVPASGRLDELDAAFLAGRRAMPADRVAYGDAATPVFKSPWSELLWKRPDRDLGIGQAAQLAASLRAAVLSRAGDAASPLLHGHQGRHAAWTILPDVGHAHAHGRVLGLGLWLPRNLDDAARTACALPLMQVDHLWLGERRIRFDMTPAHQSIPLGLRARTWTRASRVWHSVTPAVLDRHPKRGQRIEDVLADSVEMAGYPRPLEVVADGSSNCRGVPAARFFRPRSGGHWTHLSLVFAQPVAGPLLVGRDRHFGMGLMRPAGG